MLDIFFHILGCACSPHLFLAIGKAIERMYRKIFKSGHHQGKPSCKLQNAVQTQPTYYPNKINKIHVFTQRLKKCNAHICCCVHILILYCCSLDLQGNTGCGSSYHVPNPGERMGLTKGRFTFSIAVSSYVDSIQVYQLSKASGCGTSATASFQRRSS